MPRKNTKSSLKSHFFGNNYILPVLIISLALLLSTLFLVWLSNRSSYLEQGGSEIPQQQPTYEYLPSRATNSDADETIPPRLEGDEAQAVHLDAEPFVLQEVARQNLAVEEGYSEYAFSEGINTNGEWFFSSIESYPIEPPLNAPIVIPNTYLIAGKKEASGEWTIGIEGHENYARIVNATPEIILSHNSKAIFLRTQKQKTAD